MACADTTSIIFSADWERRREFEDRQSEKVYMYRYARRAFLRTHDFPLLRVDTYMYLVRSSATVNLSTRSTRSSKLESTCRFIFCNVHVRTAPSQCRVHVSGYGGDHAL